MVYTNLSQLIGNTPLLSLDKITKKLNLSSKIIAKLEYFNPLGSIKDRAAYSMLNEALNVGLINKETLIVEPTSGNTGVGLAFLCAEMGLKLVLTMPENMSIERRKLLSALGARIILTEGSLGMRGAIAEAEKICENNPNSFMPNQFENKDNAKIHREVTAFEIIRDMDGDFDYFVSCVGSGGTLTGIAQTLNDLKPEVKVIAVEPSGSPVLSGGMPGFHKIQGIGAGFVPSILDASLIDEVVTVNNDEAYEYARMLAKECGLLVGISSGAALAGAIKIAQEHPRSTIVTIFPDSGERYLSTDLF